MPPPQRHRPHKQQTTGTELATVEVPSHRGWSARYARWGCLPGV